MAVNRHRRYTADRQTIGQQVYYRLVSRISRHFDFSRGFEFRPYAPVHRIRHMLLWTYGLS